MSYYILADFFSLLFDWISDGSYFKIILVYGSCLILLLLSCIIVTRWIFAFGEPLFIKYNYGHFVNRYIKTKIFVFSESPLAFALVYLTLIPTFAGIYASLPESSLYSSTRKLDHHFYQEQYDYRAIFNELMSKRIKPVSERTNYQNVYASTQNIEEYGDLYFKIQYVFEVKDNCRKDCSDLTWDIYAERFRLNRFPTNGPNGTSLIPAYISDTKCLNGTCPSVEDLFSDSWKSVDNIDALPFNEKVKRINFYMTKDQFKNYKEMSNAFDGNALGKYGKLSRAMYFSTAVITTLGFGDIVPISDTARMAIMFQAIAGVVIMGLFFNALALRVSNRSK